MMLLSKRRGDSRGKGALAKTLVGAVILAAVVASGGCGGSDTTTTISAIRGRNCLLNSECQGDLVCSLGRCHEACKDADDCPGGERCVVGPEDLNICLLPDEDTCVRNSQCPEPLVCARDLACRTECEEARDCATATQVCVGSGDGGVCVEPDELDDAGTLPQLTAANAGSASDAGVSGDGGDRDAAEADAGQGAMDGGPPDAGPDADPDDDDGTDVGDAGGDQMPDTSETDGAMDGDTTQEQEPNDDATTAMPITAGVPVLASLGARDDVDHYLIDVPEDNPAGGYFVVTMADVGPGGAWLEVFDASTGAAVYAVASLVAGADRVIHWAAAAGETYRIEISRSTGANTFAYTLESTFTPIDDPFEPNQTRETPAALALGETVSAFMFAGFSEATTTIAEFDDWYALQSPLVAGTVQVSVTDVPIGVRIGVALMDEANTMLAPHLGQVGANVSADLPVPSDGMYRLRVYLFARKDNFGDSLPVHDFYTRDYKLTVSQP